MRFGICTGIEGVQEAADAGYDYVEMGTGALVPAEDESVFEAVKQKILEAPLRVEAFNGFLPAEYKVTGPKVDLKVVGAYMEKALRRASEVGASIMVFGSGGARRMPEGFNDLNRAWEQLAEASRLAAEIAAKYGITIAMEPLLKRACNFFNRVEQGASFVDRLAHHHLKLLADLYHVEAEGEPLSNIAAAGQRLAHIHVATPAIPETGQGTAYDFQGYFTALKQAGYDERVSLEDNPGLLQKVKGSRTVALAAALACLRKAALS